jgi:disulfide bond formation protein DsbB
MMTKKDLSQLLLFFSWLIVLVAVLSSLYASEIANIAVCKLCWYQRICVYPLVLLLGIAAYKNDTNIVPYTIPLLVIGCVLGIYQYLLTLFPGLEAISLCNAHAAVSCSDTPWSLFGWITFPLLNVVMCVFLIGLLITARKIV